jgi:hypothetical protein
MVMFDTVVRRVMIGLVVVGFLCFSLSAAIAADEKKVAGTVELKAESIAAGVGLSWGGGTLTYMGKQYPFSVSGLNVGSVGIKTATSTGKVYNLNKLEDFSGNYASIGAGATVGGGASAVAMKNQKGVVIELVSTSQGVDFTLATGGVDIKLK